MGFGQVVEAEWIGGNLVEDRESCEGSSNDKREVEENTNVGGLTLEQAFSLNALNMFGTGPFITIPLVLAGSTSGLSGPQNLIGYLLAAVLCVADSYVWGELAKQMPQSGGTYVYLRTCFGRETWYVTTATHAKQFHRVEHCSFLKLPYTNESFSIHTGVDY